MKIKKPFDLYAWRHLFAPLHLRLHDDKRAKLQRKHKNMWMELWKDARPSPGSLRRCRRRSGAKPPLTAVRLRLFAPRSCSAARSGMM